MIGVAGAAIGVGAAYAASTLMPIGLARIAEPSPGFSFDARLLAVAAAIVVALILVLAAWPIWKARAPSRSATA